MANGSPVELAMPSGGLIYGGSHTHPVKAQGDKIIPMFSVSDIYKLGEIFAKSTISNKYQNISKFFFSLTVKNGSNTETFAIKIDNWIEFASFCNQYYGMTKREKKDFAKGLERRYTKAYNSGGDLSNYLKEMFNFMNEKNITGISVYQATDSNFSNWKKLSFNSNIDNDIQESNCN